MAPFAAIATQNGEIGAFPAHARPELSETGAFPASWRRVYRKNLSTPASNVRRVGTRTSLFRRAKARAERFANSTEVRRTPPSLHLHGRADVAAQF
jgi:hypothetical protein